MSFENIVDFSFLKEISPFLIILLGTMLCLYAFQRKGMNRHFFTAFTVFFIVSAFLLILLEKSSAALFVFFTPITLYCLIKKSGRSKK